MCLERMIYESKAYSTSDSASVYLGILIKELLVYNWTYMYG
jgi:hypothetical protein